MTLVVNLIAGPGSGKSTTAAAVFSELKMNGVNAELVTEYAKDVVWEESLKKLGNQVYILGKQHHRLWRLNGQVDVIVTDCPLFMAMYYGELESNAFKELAWELFNQFDNFNYYVKRVKAYNPKGRVQTEDKARSIDWALQELLENYEVPYDFVTGDREGVKHITQKVMEEIHERQ